MTALEDQLRAERRRREDAEFDLTKQKQVPTSTHLCLESVVIESWSLISEVSLSCTQPAADVRPLMLMCVYKLSTDAIFNVLE